MKILFNTTSFERKYLVNTTGFEFDSASELIFELFSKHNFIDKEVELYLYDLLKESNYPGIEQIPKQQLNSILDYLVESNEFKISYDEERLTYLLLAAIQSKKIVFTIDNQVIENLLQPISLEKDSIISFFNLSKLDLIDFKIK